MSVTSSPAVLVTQPAITPRRQLVLGCLAAFSVTLIWATWLVASRTGAKSPLTPFDLAALRYGVSAIVALPIVLYYRPWRTMSVGRIATVSFLLGPQYILAVFFAFEFAPAAHGGVFMNGALPAITLFISWVFLKDKPRTWQIVGVVLILSGAGFSAADGSVIDQQGVWIGDVLFVVAAIFFAGYVVLGRLWSVSATQVLLCSSIVNGVYFVPLWYFFLPSGIAETSTQQLLIQTLYQGLIPGLIGLLLVAYASRNAGPAVTASFMAAVPALGTLLGVAFLGEIPGFIGWLGLVVLTPGIILVACFSGRKQRVS